MPGQEAQKREVDAELGSRARKLMALFGGWGIGFFGMELESKPVTGLLP